MNHVTSGTARKLEDAGFPQPEMEWGQYWYSVNGHEILITGTSGRVAYGVDGSNHPYTALSPDALTFAPTATDILEELGQDCYLFYFAPEWVCQPGIKQIGDFFSDGSSAEAAAKAYFAKATLNGARSALALSENTAETVTP